MKKKLFTSVVAVVLAAVLAVPAFAGVGPGYTGGQTVKKEETSQSAENTAAETAAGSTVSTGKQTAPAALTAAGNGPVSADPVLGQIPDVHVQFKTGDGNLTDGFVSGGGWFNSPLDGFCGLKIRLEYSIGDVSYRAYTEEHGWTRWAMNSMDTDWFNDAAKITAVQIRMKGHTSNLFDVYYQAKLNDGTTTGWAKNGQSCGTIGTGKYIQQMQFKLWKKGVPLNENMNKRLIAAGEEGIVFSSDGRASYSKADGSLYTGWAYDTGGDKYYFIDNQPVTGWQEIDGFRYYFDDCCHLVTDLESVLGDPGGYMAKVNKDMKTMTIYARDDAGKYTIPYKVFLCTIGSATPIGEFKLFERYNWKFMHDDIYVQYLQRYKTPGFCIHSIIYYPTEGSYMLRANSYNELGKNKSDGCIRLKSGDCAWFYSHLSTGSVVQIYSDEWSTGPFDRPCIEQAIPLAQNWDPSDPVVINDLANHTGPFTEGEVTVAYPDTFVNTLLAHGDYDLALTAGRASGMELPENIEELAAQRAAEREEAEKKD